ncbi:MAG: hypothetical protein LBJ44_08460 [Propionibacteriaceae bacterium]|nr:hypothetical protein [Propionibacteriaceae bacterium]
MTAHLTLYISGIINGADVSLGISAHATPDELRVTYNVWSGLGEESVDLTEGDITNINLGDGTEARNRQLADFVGRALAVFKNCYQMILDELRRKLVGRSETDSSGIGGLDQNEDWLLHFDYDRTKTWSW